jgi:hypothetical protein
MEKKKKMKKKRLDQKRQKRASGEKTSKRLGGCKRGRAFTNLSRQRNRRLVERFWGRRLSGSILPPVFLSHLSCLGGEDAGKEIPRFQSFRSAWRASRLLWYLSVAEAIR